MERQIPVEMGYLFYGAIYGLVLGIIGNLWTSTYIEIVVNKRNDLWNLFWWWTICVAFLIVLFFIIGKFAFRRGRDIQHEIASLKEQLREMKKQIESKIEELYKLKEKQIG